MAPLRAVALLAFASHAAAQLAGGATGGGGVNCCGGGGSCGFEHCPLLGAGEEGCVQPWNMPNGLSFDDCNQGGGAGSCTPEDIDAMMSTDPESSQAELDAAMSRVNPACMACLATSGGPPGGGGARIDVGGDNGWIVQGAYDDISASVGDTLVFSYTAGYHDVMLIDNTDCDFSGGTMLDETGSFEFTLTEPGEFIFACTKGSHCASGQQIQRVVVAGPPAGGPAGGGSSCPEDLDGDGLVNVNDLLALLSGFGGDGSKGEDVDGDGLVNVNDLLQLLSNFGTDDCVALDLSTESGGPGGGDGPPTIEQLDSMCPAEMAACRSARNCMGPLETSLLPENSEEPPSGTAEIDAIVACFMQGMMSEAFGPCLGGPPGGGVGVGLPVGPVGPTEMCPDSPPQMCRRMCPELAPDACAAGQCMMRQGSCCDMECAALGGGGGGGNCAAGDDCGGQERTDCGTSCPPICGEPPAQFCVFMCFVGYQCPVRSPRPLRTVRACFPLA